MSKPGTKAPELVPLKWRARAHQVRAGSLFQFVREYLCRHGGAANRAELLKAMQTEPRIRSRLERSQEFDRVLANMRYSGWVELAIG